MTTKLSAEDFNALLAEEMPFALKEGVQALSIGDNQAVLKIPYDEKMLRPGGTISGPTMMMLADATMYATLLGAIGVVKLAVTTNFSINFLHRPKPVDLLAEGKILKLGKRLAVMEVTVMSDGQDHPVAHATGTYSIPPNR